MSYTKYTRTIVSGQDLLDFISTTAVLNGWTSEFTGDNIISSVNLGKKLILKKDSKYIYLAASDNNNPTDNNTSFITNNICCLKYCVSTSLNTANRWWDNSIRQGSSTANYIDGLQYANGAVFNIYANADHMIFVSFVGVGLYTAGLIGNLKPVSHTNVFAAFGCLLTNTGLTGTRLTTCPFLDLKNGLKQTLVNNSLVKTSSDGLVINNFVHNNGSAPASSYTAYTTSYLGDDQRLGVMNSAINDEFLITVDVDGSYNTGNGAYQRFFYFDDLSIVNFKNLDPNTTKENGDIDYDVYPFYKKEIPQNYNNLESFGLGFAFKMN